MAATEPLLGESELRQRWTPQNDPDWNPDLPYGGKVYLARKKKPDPMHVRVAEVINECVHSHIQCPRTWYDIVDFTCLNQRWIIFSQSVKPNYEILELIIEHIIMIIIILLWLLMIITTYHDEI